MCEICVKLWQFLKNSAEMKDVPQKEKNAVFLAHSLSIFYIPNSPRLGVLQYVKHESMSCLVMSSIQSFSRFSGPLVNFRVWYHAVGNNARFESDGL